MSVLECFVRLYLLLYKLWPRGRPQFIRSGPRLDSRNFVNLVISVNFRVLATSVNLRISGDYRILGNYHIRF